MPGDRLRTGWGRFDALFSWSDRELGASQSGGSGMPRSWLRIALVANDAFAGDATIGGLLCRNPAGRTLKGSGTRDASIRPGGRQRDRGRVLGGRPDRARYGGLRSGRGRDTAAQRPVLRHRLCAAPLHGRGPVRPRRLPVAHPGPRPGPDLRRAGSPSTLSRPSRRGCSAVSPLRSRSPMGSSSAPTTSPSSRSSSPACRPARPRASLFTRYNPHGLFIAGEALGYLTMSLSLLFAALVFVGPGIERAIRWLFIADFLLTVTAAIGLWLIGGDLVAFEVSALDQLACPDRLRRTPERRVPASRSGSLGPELKGGTLRG